MKKQLFSLLLLLNIFVFSQTDFSDQWEDFYSYNNVKDFSLVDNKLYAIVDNAVFIYDLELEKNQKFSSVHGLSGNEISSFLFSETTNNIIIGYETGLLEIIDKNGNIHVSDDVVRLNISGSKRINHIVEYNNKLYLSTAFSVLEYDLENFQFGDTFYIGDGSSTVNINQIAVLDDTIYAATENGIYKAEVTNPFLIDYNNWQQPTGNLLGNFTSIIAFNGKLITSKNQTLYQLFSSNSLPLIRNFGSGIVNLNASDNFLTVSLNNKAYTLDVDFNEINLAAITTDFNFKLSNAYTINQTTYLATDKYGILRKNFNDLVYDEIHPDGPSSNEAFSIEVKDSHLWVVYGAYNLGMNPTSKRKGFSHFNTEQWINTPNSALSGIRDLVDISIDPTNSNNAYICSYLDGLVEVIDDEVTNIYNHTNSSLEVRSGGTSQSRLGGAAYDKEGNLWISNGWAEENKVQELKADGTWASYNINDALTGYHGLGKVVIDNIGNKWMSSNIFGAMVLNKAGTRAKALKTNITKGNLPVNKVKSFVVDRDNRIWIGTTGGLRRFDDVATLFEVDEYQAKKIIIRLEGGTGDDQGQVLLGDQPIYTIAVDGADNKWFGTANSGVLGTNPSGQKTLYIFNKDNSPLPTNEINEIRVDNTTGKVYFATSKGIVVFNNNVAPFGDSLGETYAYPNPSTKDNEFITIDGRNGTHLPYGTNVKILDSAGYLVHETNTVEGAEVKGGKVIWNKTNLTGRKVASGIYTILLTISDTSETSITKVAIIN